MTEEPINEAVEEQVSQPESRDECEAAESPPADAGAPAQAGDERTEEMDAPVRVEADEAADGEQPSDAAGQDPSEPGDEEPEAAVAETKTASDEPDRTTAAEEEEEDDDAESQWDGILRAGEVEATLESVVEAILFASDEPLTPARIVSVLEAGSAKQVRQCVQSLNARYQESNASFRIEKIAGGYQMMTLPAYNHWLKKMVRVRSDNKLTGAALETLAIVAYKQPIIRADVEAIRGVACGEVLRNLMYKGMVKMVGRAEVLGRPVLYGTTKKFLDAFGLHSLKDLPKIEELKRPDA